MVESVSSLGWLAFPLWHGSLAGAADLFWTSTFGPLWTYATRPDTWGLIRRRGAFPILVSPDDPSALIAAIRAASGAAPEPAPR